jgi:psp operon transcriptional activator
MLTSHAYDPNSAPADAYKALGESEAFLDFQDQLSLVAKVDRPVLVVGERGTGKELAARSLHYLSKRWREPLCELNCAALAPTLIESELFGHEPGAFTGATGRRTGRFEKARNGTLFLDELGNIPLPVQEKILRVVEYGSFERVGGSEPVRVDVRIVGATNADLPAMAAQGRFMRDLLDRLSFEVLYIPPLRDRQEDILLLARHFAARMAAELERREAPEFSEDAMAAMEAHAWPGNVRELKNVVERAVYRAQGRVIREVVFDPFRQTPQEPDSVELVPGRTEEKTSQLASSRQPFREAVACYEKNLLDQALQCARYNQRQAAKLLALTYHQFRGLHRKHYPNAASES